MTHPMKVFSCNERVSGLVIKLQNVLSCLGRYGYAFGSQHSGYHFIDAQCDHGPGQYPDQVGSKALVKSIDAFPS